jgi:REP element-mobilizing transposase RayT
LVWATWDRLPLLVGEVETCAHRGIGATCARLGSEVTALGGVADHIHLLLRLPLTLSVAELVGQVKGATSHLLTHEVLTDGSFFKWQGSYGAVSVSPRHLPVVAAYVTHQRTHHAEGSLRAGLELP